MSLPALCKSAAAPARQQRGGTGRSPLPAARPRLPRVCAAASSVEPPAAFEPRYQQLAGVLAAPASAVTAGRTPLGRGLVTTQDVAAGRTLLSVDWANLLCVTDQPSKTGNAFGRRVLEDWQLLHGRLPPLLNRYLLSGACMPSRRPVAGVLASPGVRRLSAAARRVHCWAAASLRRLPCRRASTHPRRQMD